MQTNADFFLCISEISVFQRPKQRFLKRVAHWVKTFFGRINFATVQENPNPTLTLEILRTDIIILPDEFPAS